MNLEAEITWERRNNHTVVTVDVLEPNLTHAEHWHPGRKINNMVWSTLVYGLQQHGVIPRQELNETPFDAILRDQHVFDKVGSRYTTIIGQFDG